MKLRISSIFSRRARWVWSGVLVAVVAFYGASVVWYAGGQRSHHHASGRDTHTVWIGRGAIGWDREGFGMLLGQPPEVFSRVEWSCDVGRYRLARGAGNTGGPGYYKVVPAAGNVGGPKALREVMASGGRARAVARTGEVVYHTEATTTRVTFRARIVAPLWPVILAVLVSTGVSWVRHVKERWRRRAMLCAWCGYSLGGLPAGARCPECGGQGHPPGRRKLLVRSALGVVSARSSRRWAWTVALVAVAAGYAASTAWYAGACRLESSSAGAGVTTAWIGLGSVGWHHEETWCDDPQPWGAFREWSRVIGRSGERNSEPTLRSGSQWSRVQVAMNLGGRVRCAHRFGEAVCDREVSLGGRMLKARLVVPLWPLVLIVLVPTCVSWRRCWRERRSGGTRCGGCG